MLPTQITVANDRKSLIVNWDDGSASDLPAPFLRRHCQSARAKRARIDWGDGAISGDLTIAEIHAVGRYAINLVFSDGHDRGIYPWAYLRELGENFEFGN